MTKLYISADLEGACGVTSPLQCSPAGDRAAYEWAVNQLAREVKEVVETALERGVEEIVINDSHYGMANLLLPHISPQVSLLSGKPKVCAMSAGLDSRFDGAIYIGYHAKAGTPHATLCHTFHSRVFDVSINGVSYGEGGINALHASLVHGVPVVMASGDQALEAELKALIPALEMVRTKDALSTTAALSRPLFDVMADYRAKTNAVLDNQAAWRKNLLTLKPPYEMTITFTTSLGADTAMTLPILTRVDGRTVCFTADNFQAVYQALQSAYSLQGYTAYLGSDF